MTKNEIQAAIEAHQNWKRHFTDAIAGRPISVDLATASDCNICMLGRWLASISVDDQTELGRKYHEIMDLHRNFHTAAGKIVSALEEHRLEEAKSILRDEYSTSSSALSAALLDWKWSPSAGA